MKTNSEQFDQEVVQSKIPVLVDFFATWCGPCRMLTPVLESVSKEFEGRAKVVKVDIDESPELAARYGITAVPTLLLFAGGKVVDKAMGFQSPKQLADMLNRVSAPVAS
ncbi:MAG TPA: thioredoxin [Candidatus Paceibacterota bacterium]|nr:thioredoxin [Verrucomicrobiota bacterium]HRY48199.1 thioredoxin [Candidatus Paceibacterota bacterium]HSA03308.1 thioredoxin [Candidatus Paceibacterota bacterium]